jgi:tetratricopeptide (TPR) repeat protein
MQTTADPADNAHNADDEAAPTDFMRRDAFDAAVAAATHDSIDPDWAHTAIGYIAPDMTAQAALRAAVQGQTLVTSKHTSARAVRVESADVIEVADYDELDELSVSLDSTELEALDSAEIAYLEDDDVDAVNIASEVSAGLAGHGLAARPRIGRPTLPDGSAEPARWAQPTRLATAERPAVINRGPGKPPPVVSARPLLSQDPALPAHAAKLLSIGQGMSGASQVFVVAAAPGAATKPSTRAGRTRDPEEVRNAIGEHRAAGNHHAIVALLEDSLQSTDDLQLLSEWHTELGDAHDAMLAPDRAMLEYGRALEADPDYDLAQYAIERTAQKLEAAAAARWHEVASGLRRATERSPSDVRLVGWYALLYRIYANELKRRDVAAEVYSKLLRLDPGHPVVLERMANEARAQGDAAKQADFLTRAVSVTTRTDLRARLFLNL